MGTEPDTCGYYVVCGLLCFSGFNGARHMKDHVNTYIGGREMLKKHKQKGWCNSTSSSKRRKKHIGSELEEAYIRKKLQEGD